MDEAISLGINDPVLIELYKSLNEIQQGIVRKLPEENRISFLNFVKEAREKEAAKLAKMDSEEKEMYFKKKEADKIKRRESIKLKKKTSSPLEEFLEDKKFSPVDKKLILSEWDHEATNRELIELAKQPYTPPEWLKEGWNPDKYDKKSPKNDGWDDSPSIYARDKPILNWSDLPKIKNPWDPADLGEVFGKDVEEEEEEEDKKPKKLTQPQIEFEKLVNTYYQLAVGNRGGSQIPELEVRFGTRGINKLTKNDYDNVIQKLMSQGFTTNDPNGLYSLRIQSEFVEQNSGKIMLSPIRTEIENSRNIQEYCNTNDIKTLMKNGGAIIRFNKKTNVLNDKGDKIFPVNFDDFNFRVSLQNEEIFTI